MGLGLNKYKKRVETEEVEDTSPFPISPTPFIKRFDGKPSVVFCDGDNHYPIHDERMEEVKFTIAQDLKPDLWVNVGDLYDLHSVSNFPKDPLRMFQGTYTLQAEFDSAQPYWSEVCRIAKRIVLLQGNHELRFCRKLSDEPGFYGLKVHQFATLANLPKKVETVDYGCSLQVGQLNFRHGDEIGGRYGWMDPAVGFAKTNMGSTSTIFGHFHRTQILYKMIYTHEGPRLIATIAQGHSSDVKKAGYVKTPPWTLGCTVLYFSSDGNFSVYPVIPDSNYRVNFCGKVYKG